MGLDVFTPGNWEPSYGPAIFKDTTAKLGCPVVCYNLTDTTTGERLYPASVVLQRGDVKNGSGWYYGYRCEHPAAT